MPAAIIGGAIAAVGGIGSAIISNKGASKAAEATTQAAQTATDSQTQMYAQNAAALSPFQATGIGAMGQINAMLGIGNTGTYGGQQAQQMVEQAPAGDFGYGGMGGEDFGGQYGMGGRFGQRQFQQPRNALMAQPAQGNPWDGFKNYLEGSNYAFEFDRGANAVNSGYAGAGTVKSGAAMKGIEDYRQGLQSGYRGEYMNALGNQQALGFSAASAQAGVGQNFANNISNIAMNKGDNLANASLVKSQNTANALGSVANTAGYLYGRYG